MRFGFGLRWAQMGVFETYRVAGGEAGMRHFLAQFGPCLKWPWTTLTDVPEFDDALVELIAGQSDAQSGHIPIRELERIRDDNLIAIHAGAEGDRLGRGQAARRVRAAPVRPRRRRARRRPTSSQPIRTTERRVPPDWTDYNDHMNEARYLQAFADATDAFMRLIGCDADYIAQGGSYFTAETHIRHLGEANAGDPIVTDTQVIEGQGKRMRLFHELRHARRPPARHRRAHADPRLARHPRRLRARPGGRARSSRDRRPAREAARARRPRPRRRPAEVAPWTSPSPTSSG